MDHHIHGAMTRGLRLRGVDVLTANEDGGARMGDEPLLRRATDLGRMFVTEDDDLLEIAHQWSKSGQSFAGLVYTKPLSMGIGKAIEDLHLIAEVYEPDQVVNFILYIPL
jgi:hypothetical protein